MKTFDVNKLVRKNIQNMKSYSSARDEFKDFNTEKMFYLTKLLCENLF